MEKLLFNANVIGKKIHKIFENANPFIPVNPELDGEKEEIETPDMENGEIEDTDAEETGENGENGENVEKKEHEIIDELSDAADEIKSAVDMIKASEELEHDNTIDKETHEKIEAKASEKIEQAKQKLQSFHDEFKNAENKENTGMTTDTGIPQPEPEKENGDEESDDDQESEKDVETTQDDSEESDDDSDDDSEEDDEKVLIDNKK
jgi:hypothetical protein